MTRDGVLSEDVVPVTGADGYREVSIALFMLRYETGVVGVCQTISSGDENVITIAATFE